MCDCISYNRPDLTGDAPSVALTYRGKVVYIDACIADHMQALWAGDVATLGSCCGHNGVFPRSVVVEPSDHIKADRILKARGADIAVKSWQLCDTPPSVDNKSEDQG